MSRYTEPKNRIARRFGVNIFVRARNPLLHKPTPPGQHGSKRRKKSDYALQLEEQQKLRAAYGMLTVTQLTRYYQSASHSTEHTPKRLVQLLETRLDSIIYRLGLAQTIFMSQQLVSHGHILVNSKKIDIRSYHVPVNAKVSINPSISSSLSQKISQTGQTREIPIYLSREQSALSGQLLTLPAIEDIPYPLPINVSLVCERLARSR